jgi:hypothetical protein
MREQEVRELYQAYLDVYSNSNKGVSEVEQLNEDFPKQVGDFLKRGGDELRKRLPGVAAALTTGKGGTVTAAQQKAKIKPVGEEVENWVNSLIDEGYDLSEYTWDDMYEMYVNLDEEAPERITKRTRNKKLMKNAGPARVHNPNNMGEETNLFDTILEYLVAEGYADTNESALAIMANMSEEWRESIVEARVDDGKSKEDKRKIRTARAGRAGVNLPNSSLHTGDIDRRDAHRTADDLNKDAKDIRKGRLNLPQFQGTTGRERVAQVKKEKGIR